MPTTQQLRKRLSSKLKELFQLDQPDLDFGFYAIMHAKAEQVSAFIENDLLRVVTDAFGQLEMQNSQDLVAQAKQKVIDTLGEEAFDVSGNLVDAFKGTPAGKKYGEEMAKIEQNKNALSAEADIYDHLYRFFERYYDAGDFISRRYYTRETAGKAAPFAIPYNGEEVKLHWANADQYYIKTAEYFANFTFDLRQAAEVRAQRLPMSFGEDESPLRVHFRVVEASEGEHGNVKASEANKRFFIIHADNPVALSASGELVINFQYRVDPEKTGQDNTWRDKRNDEAAEVILDALGKVATGDEGMAEYLRLLQTAAPTEKEKTRPLLAKYINQYTARNTMDYFIHKDLGGFLRRELDFYIKNEVMRLDDIENAEAPAVETYLAKIKVLRKIAGKLIDFLTQLEEFQKKLWLKKKFVVETNYCITLDRVPEELYPEIAANAAQREEWVNLFAIDEIQASTIGPGYSVPLSVDFLKANDKLVLDTQFFDETFKTRLLAAIENFDEQCNGLLVHSDNFHALRMLNESYKARVQCIHIDPPYNTATSGFLYKNEYQHSSWLAMMENRLSSSMDLLVKSGSYLCHIDENEYENLFALFENFQMPNAGTVVWDKRNPMNGGRGVATQHEYIIWRSGQSGPIYMRNKTIHSMLAKAQALINSEGAVTDRVRKEFSTWINGNTALSGGEKAYRYIDNEGRIYQSVSLRAPEPRADGKFHQPLIHPMTGKPCSIPPNGFSRTPETLQGMIERGEILFGEDETTQPRQKVYLTEETQRQFSSLIQDAKKGKTDTSPMGVDFPYCHPTSLYQELIGAVSHNSDDYILDFFAGSGTTGHAVIILNRDERSNRKYVLVEMGDYFDTVLKPRMAKVVYSPDWKDGKPTARSSGVSHCFKYLRLESYEDTLNNLRFNKNPTCRAVAANASLKEDYMLNYLLDVETRGSQSLLNIDAFFDPTAYVLNVKKPGTDEYVEKAVDLVETFNYLIGVQVNHLAAPQTFTAEFERLADPELPEDQHTKLVVNGRIRQDEAGPWWFRKVEGWVPKDPTNPNNGQQEKVLIVWRKLTGDLEKDNLMLDEWFQRNRINTRDFEFDTIYVNGSNNLPNLKLDEESWKVRLTEEEFMKRMWSVEGI